MKENVTTFESCEYIVSNMLEVFFGKWYTVNSPAFLEPLYEFDKGLQKVYDECVKSDEHSIECIKDDGEILLMFSNKENPHYFTFSYTQNSFVIRYDKKNEMKEFKRFFKYLKKDCIKQSKISSKEVIYRMMHAPQTLKEKEKIRKKQNKTMKLIMGVL